MNAAGLDYKIFIYNFQWSAGTGWMTRPVAARHFTVVAEGR